MRKRRAVVVGGMLALLVGFSRIYVGAHFPLDVVSGLLVGGMFGVATWKLHDALDRWWRRRKEARVAA